MKAFHLSVFLAVSGKCNVSYAAKTKQKESYNSCQFVFYPLM
jgi:hypothetical protein